MADGTQRYAYYYQWPSSFSVVGLTFSKAKDAGKINLYCVDDHGIDPPEA